jgi:hypothetical protein
VKIVPGKVWVLRRQTSIHLPVDLHKRVRKYAFDQEVTLSAVMVDAIEAR